MSKQLAVAISFSVLATLALALFGVAPAMHLEDGGSAQHAVQVEAATLPDLSQLLPGRY